MPTATCLLAEARESAKTIGRDAFRDWALSEILIAQARAGLGEAAYETVSQIRDPRLVIVALGDIANAKASTGNPIAAISAANLIPDYRKKAEIILSISEIQQNRGEIIDARKTLEAFLQNFSSKRGELEEVSFLTRAAIVIYQIGDKEHCNKLLKKVEKLITKQKNTELLDSAHRYLAVALANVEQINAAFSILKKIKKDTNRDPVRMNIVRAHGKVGYWVKARETAKQIESYRFKAIAFAQIAASQTSSGSEDLAEKTLALARSAISKIKRPFAKSYAKSLVAIEVARLYSRERPTDSNFLGLAVQIATNIIDPRLKARTLWLLSEHRRTNGDQVGAEKIALLAMEKTYEIGSAFSQAWMFSSLAIEYAYSNNLDAGWAAFQNGLKIAKSIENSWNRARTLAKLATTMIILIDPGRGYQPIQK
jgi:hypothetical protein